MRFRIAQCLCGPARHAIMGMALGPETDDISDDVAARGLRSIVHAIASGRGADLKIDGLPPQMNPWCSLCGAPMRDWLCEVRQSRAFASCDEAQRVLKACAAAQQATRLLLDLIDESFDARLRRDDGKRH